MRKTKSRTHTELSSPVTNGKMPVARSLYPHGIGSVRSLNSVSDDSLNGSPAVSGGLVDE